MVIVILDKSTVLKKRARMQSVYELCQCKDLVEE